MAVVTHNGYLDWGFDVTSIYDDPTPEELLAGLKRKVAELEQDAKLGIDVSVAFTWEPTYNDDEESETK